MKNDKNPLRKDGPPMLVRHTSEGNGQIQVLRAQLKALNQTSQQKQNQLMAISSKLRSEGLRNQKLKKQIIQADQKMQQFAKKQVQYFFEKYKGNKDSPLFYNQAGLSPFELLRIGQSKFQDMGESHICMVCFGDLEKGLRIMKLPCTHLLHKQCGIQHLLYCKQCPACSKDLK